MVKRGLTEIQLKVLGSIAANGKQNIQEIQLREELNYATTNRSVKMLDRLSFIWLSSHNEEMGPKAPQFYGLTPLGVVEAFLRGGKVIGFDGVLEHWGEVAPRYIHNWGKLKDGGLSSHLWKCLWRLYPERVVINRVLPLGSQTIFYDYIQSSNFSVIRDGLDQVLLDVAVEDICVSEERESFMKVVSGDPEYLRVWSFWFWMQENRFKHVHGLNTDIEKRFKRVQENRGNARMQ